MEVHHHPHVEKKSVKEYLLEGLMIFIAVSLGFIAENIHERSTNNEIEKNNIEIILENLRLDTSLLRYTIEKNEDKAAYLDSILFFKRAGIETPGNLKKMDDLLFNAVTDYLFHGNRAAYEQMKASGSLRLVKNRQVLDSLFNYEQKDWLVTDNGRYYSDCSKRLLEDMLGLFDIATDHAALLESGLTSKELQLRLGKFYNDVAAFRGDIVSFYNPALISQKTCAGRLIQLLEKEYHLAEVKQETH